MDKIKKIKRIRDFLDNYNDEVQSLPIPPSKEIDGLFKKELWDFISSQGWEIKGRGRFYNPIKNIYYLTNTEIKNEIKRFLIPPTQQVIDHYYIIKKSEAHNKRKVFDSVIETLITMMLAAIKHFNQYQTIEYTFDPFLESDVSFNNQIMTIQSNQLLKDDSIINGIDPKGEPERFKEFLKDYTEHFKEWRDFLDFILALRFGADKKRGYLWFKAESDWGKSLLFNKVLGDLGIITEIKESEIKSAIKGSPVGISPNDFFGSWILFVDEFKSAVSEIKDITHHLRFSPKGQLRTTVPLFAKVFASAENVPSLTDGETMEIQFQNRFMIWELKGQLTQRPLFTENKLEYTESIKILFFRYLKREIKKYISLGKVEASKQADKTLNEIRDRYKKEYLTIEEKIRGYASEYRLHFRSIIGQNPKISKDIIFTKDGSVYVANKRLWIEAFIDHFFDSTLDTQIKKKDLGLLLGLDPKRKTLRIEESEGFEGKVSKIKSGYFWFDIGPKDTRPHKSEDLDSLQFLDDWK